MNTSERLHQLRQMRWIFIVGAVLAAALGFVVLLMWALAIVLLVMAGYNEWLIHQGSKVLRS